MDRSSTIDLTPAWPGRTSRGLRPTVPAIVIDDAANYVRINAGTYVTSVEARQATITASAVELPRARVACIALSRVARRGGESG